MYKIQCEGGSSLMAIPYGISINASDMRNMLEKNDVQQSGVRSWRQLFGNASLGHEAQADTLKSYYNDATSQAYKSNFEQQNAIMGAGLNIGATRELVSANRQDLQNTYENYVKNYSADKQTIGTAYGEEVGAISQGLTERAEKFSNLYNSAYTYLSDELSQNPDFFNKGGYKWLTDEDGNVKPWEDIAPELKNDDGSLSGKGIEFFDQLFNARTEGSDVRGFGEWLNEQDEDLYNWAKGQDVFNYTYAGTNLGTANVMSGRESTDDTYKFTQLEAENTAPYNEAMQKLLALDNQTTKARGGHEPYGSAIAQAVTNPENWSTEWSAYKTQARSLLTGLKTNLEKTVGNEAYDINFDDYEKLIKQLDETVVYDKALMEKITTAYNKLLKEATTFIKKQEKKSGY